MQTARISIQLFAAAAAAMHVFARIASAEETDWELDWIALTVSQDGAWGSAMHASRLAAMSAAIAQCRANAPTSGSGCGSHTTTVRGAWSVAYACDSTNFIVSGRTYAEARAAAINREIQLREFDLVDLGACRRLVAIGPTGETASPQVLSEVVPVIGDQ